MIPKGYIFKPASERLLDKVSPEPNSGCWLWTGSVNPDGYGNFNLQGFSEKAHRASWILFRGAIVNGLHVLHHCDTPSCVNPHHLFLGTPQDNKADCVSKQRHSTARGERAYRAVLTRKQVLEIKRCLASGESCEAVATRYGVSGSAIYHIQAGRSWGWLTLTEREPETVLTLPNKATVER